mmetsp:Transcript_25588/g.64051  ORF Transcript_25588/g.64051 Transcript_25588/m.64051 type:complete len:219 (-) Transcript_25588:1033-1689(-)
MTQRQITIPRGRVSSLPILLSILCPTPPGRVWQPPRARAQTSRLLLLRVESGGSFPPASSVSVPSSGASMVSVRVFGPAPGGKMSTCRCGSAASLVSSVNRRFRLETVRSVSLSTTVSAPIISYRFCLPRSSTHLACASKHASVTVVLLPKTMVRLGGRPMSWHARSMGSGSGSQSDTSSADTTCGSPRGASSAAPGARSCWKKSRICSDASTSHSAE